ncbi:MAG TPA: tRNA (adenosine(37)-N6)-threonylcarbamoyltransferase complex ATPase subunit type 1 TsaE [Microbacteriaceae bacterium]|nr:tRNA (adenosine(37)-N6)-threonylcarbamoyltransferase complex ATPase subunit type 1 TsaE [Microbacteriaceae bacterium]
MSLNWTERLTLETSADAEAFGAALAVDLAAGDVLVLSGALGAGKTTLTRGIGSGFGVRGPITSPTFVVARTHPSECGGAPLVHVDAYRLADAREFDDLDIDFAASLVVVEWGAGMLDGVVDSWLEIDLQRGRGDDTDASTDEEPRECVVRGYGPRWRDRPGALA